MHDVMISIYLAQICEIIGAQEGPKVYSLGSTKTNKALKLRYIHRYTAFQIRSFEIVMFLLGGGGLLNL